MTSTGLAHIANWLIGMGVVIVIGYLTRGWFLRVAGRVYAGIAAIILAAIPYQHDDLTGKILTASFLGAVGFGLWIWGHLAHAQRTGRWRSTVAYQLLDRYGMAQRVLARVTKHGRGDRAAAVVGESWRSPANPRGSNERHAQQ